MTEPLVIKELGLGDLLSDPLVRLLMQSDGIVPDDVRRQMLIARQHVKARGRKLCA